MDFGDRETFSSLLVARFHLLRIMRVTNDCACVPASPYTHFTGHYRTCYHRYSPFFGAKCRVNMQKTEELSLLPQGKSNPKNSCCYFPLSGSIDDELLLVVGRRSPL